MRVAATMVVVGQVFHQVVAVLLRLELLAMVVTALSIFTIKEQ
jgi:hypothetical protein